MTADLFSAHEVLEHIPMQDAEVYYLRHLPLADTAHAVMRHLIDEVPLGQNLPAASSDCVAR